MTRPHGVKTRPYGRKRRFAAFRIAGLALALAAATGTAHADLIEYRFTGTDGTSRAVPANQQYVNPVGNIKFTLTAGLDRRVRVSILDQNGQELSTTESHLLTAEDQFYHNEQRTYGTELELPAPGEGEYTIRAEILGRWGNAIQIDEYPMVVDLTPPVITGQIRSTGLSGYANIGEGPYAQHNMFGVGLTSMIFVEGVSDNDQIESATFRSYYASGVNNGELAAEARASYTQSTNTVSIGTGQNTLTPYFPKELHDYKLEFMVIDRAGNKAVKSHVAGFGGCGVKPEPVAMQKPGHAGSYLGQPGFVAWNQGDTIWSNPARVIWRLPKSNIYPTNKYGYINFTPQFTDQNYAYMIIERAYTDYPSTNNGQFTTATHWGCIAYDNLRGPLAPGVQQSPVRGDLDLKVEGEPWGTYVTRNPLESLWWRPTTPTKIEQLRVGVERRNYLQRVEVNSPLGVLSCNVPANQESCVVNVGWTPPAPKIYSAWQIFVVDPARNLRTNGNHLLVASNYAPLTIHELDYNESTRSGTIEVTEPSATTTGQNYWRPIRGEVILKQNGDEVYRTKGSLVRFTETLFGYNFNLDEAETGIYNVAFETENYQNAVFNKSFAGTILIDHNPPTVDVNIEDGAVIRTLDDVFFTIHDDEDPNVFVRSVNLTGGPNEDNVNMGSSNQNGRIQLEYPVLFPSMVEGEEYTLTLVAEDAQGNQGSKSVTFVYDPRQVGLIDGMDGKIWVPAVEYEFLRQGGGHIIQSAPLTLNDGSPVQGSYDVIATLREDAVAPLVINGTTVYPGSTATVIRQLDFSESDGRISLPVRAAVGDVTGISKLLVTTSAPNSPILLVDVHLWSGDIELQSRTWDYRQVVDPLDIIAMPGQNVPCRVTVDEEAAMQADPVRDPVCLIEWTQTPDEAEVSTATLGGLMVAGLVGQAVRLGEQEIKWDVYLYSGDGTKVQIGEGERSINVTTALGSILFEPETTSAYQTIQELDVRFRQIEGPTCRATLSADEAITSSARGIRDGVQRVCLFEWQQMPQGLMQHHYGTVPQVLGTLDTVGEHTLGWRLSMFSRLGTRVTLAEQTAAIHVIEPPAPTVTLASNFQLDDDTFMLPITEGHLGDAVITAENAELRVDMEVEGMETVSERFPQNAWASEQSIMRRVATPPNALWEQRSVVIRAAYHALPEVETEKVYTVYTVPGQGIKPFIDTTAEAALDTELLPVTVSMADMYQFREPYDVNTMGMWRVRVLRQDGADEFVPLTDWAETVDGKADFAVDVSQTQGRTIRLTAEAELISPIEGYERTEMAPRNLFLTLLLGGEIEGDVITRRISGQAPFTAVFRAVLSEREMFPSVGDIIWETSSDDGQSWSEYVPAERQKFTFTQVFDKGVYRVRAKIVNRHSGLTQYTGQVEVTAYDKPTVQIVGPKVLFVGTSTTLHAQAVTESIELDDEGRRVRVYKEYPMEDVLIDWSLDGGRTYSHHGPSIDISSDEQVRIPVWARIRTAESPSNDASAYTIQKASVEFKPIRAPRIRLTGHSVVEKGKPYTYTAMSTLPYRDMDVPMAGYFTLPDGTEVHADTVEYVPTEEDVLNGTIDVTYTAWIEGFREEGAEASHSVRSRVWQYVWPEFAMDYRADASVAPANLTLRVRALRFSGTLESPTYEWDLPMESITVTDATNDQVRMFTVNEPGQYEFQVTVRDARGHESVVTYPVEIGEADPFTITLNYSASNLLMREPVDITIRPEIRGGHPRDRVASREYFVNGTPIEGGGLYGRTTLTAGDHDVGLRITSTMGKEVEAAIALNVVENQPPVCELRSTTTSSSMILHAQCEDPDGRIRAYEWTLNGEPVSTMSRTMSVSRRTGGDTPVITVVAVDDSGARSEVVEYQGSFVGGQ